MTQEEWNEYFEQSQRSLNEHADKLYEAQARTDAKIKELVEAQSRTDANINRLTDRLDRFATLTTENMNKLTQAMLGLTDYVARHDADIRRLQGEQGSPG
jgi:ABC-type transporter Mla subunit MlaD